MLRSEVLIWVFNRFAAVTEKVVSVFVTFFVTNELINLGYVPDCTNTELENEFEVQDIVRKILKKYKLVR
jgi:hypothetical protein